MHKVFKNKAQGCSTPLMLLNYQLNVMWLMMMIMTFASFSGTVILIFYHEYFNYRPFFVHFHGNTPTSHTHCMIRQNNMLIDLFCIDEWHFIVVPRLNDSLSWNVPPVLSRKYLMNQVLKQDELWILFWYLLKDTLDIDVFLIFYVLYNFQAQNFRNLIKKSISFKKLGALHPLGYQTRPRSGCCISACQQKGVSLQQVFIVT